MSTNQFGTVDCQTQSNRETLHKGVWQWGLALVWHWFGTGAKKQIQSKIGLAWVPPLPGSKKYPKPTIFDSSETLFELPDFLSSESPGQRQRRPERCNAQRDSESIQRALEKSRMLQTRPQTAREHKRVQDSPAAFKLCWPYNEIGSRVGGNWSF